MLMDQMGPLTQEIDFEPGRYWVFVPDSWFEKWSPDIVIEEGGKFTVAWTDGRDYVFIFKLYDYGKLGWIAEWPD